MPVLVHLSDLHFGPRLIDRLALLVQSDLEAIRPDLTIVSGDWTMRGRVSEYKQAQEYLNRLPRPLLTIPGNHDQPLHLTGLFDRLVRPWSRYRQFIHGNVDASFNAPGLIVIGLNDNHQIIPGGLWSPAQRRWMEAEFRAAPVDACKVLVMHHHLLWEGKLRPAGQWYPDRTLRRLADLGVELVLNGHTHVPITRQTSAGPIVAQAGTAMSSRTRHGYGNTYNIIRISPDTIQITVRRYAPESDTFEDHGHYSFVRRNRRPGSLDSPAFRSAADL